MAQSSAGGQILTIVLIGGAAWIGWNIYQSYLAAQYAAAAPPTPAPSTPSTATTTPAAATPQIVIPANFSVTPDINDSFRGTVTYNGLPATFNLIFSGGQATGQVFNSAGTDVTATLGTQNVQTLVAAYNAAVNAELIAGTITKATPGMSGFGGFGQAGRAVIRIPRPFRLHRIGIEG